MAFKRLSSFLVCDTKTNSAELLLLLLLLLLLFVAVVVIVICVVVIVIVTDVVAVKAIYIHRILLIDFFRYVIQQLQAWLVLGLSRLG